MLTDILMHFFQRYTHSLKTHDFGDNLVLLLSQLRFSSDKGQLKSSTLDKSP